MYYWLAQEPFRGVYCLDLRNDDHPTAAQSIIKAMKKIITWSVVLFLMIGIVIAVIWWLRRPQMIVLSDGTRLTLIGVEYGKHHIYPKMEKTEQDAGDGDPTSFDTTNDTLVVWILQEHKGNNQWLNYEILDGAGTTCVGNLTRITSQISDGKEIAGVQSENFPRRDRSFYLRVTTWVDGKWVIAKRQFTISNPVHETTFAQWTPDSLPNTQSDGDLEVTLTKLVVAALVPYVYNKGVPKTDPMNKCVQIAFDVQENNRPATNWRPGKIETSDTAGNAVQSEVAHYIRNGKSTTYFQPGLWPDETWKLRMEFTRISGFTKDEMWTVTNVPVNAVGSNDLQNVWNNDSGTNSAFAETTNNGIHFEIFPAKIFTDQSEDGDRHITINLKTDPNLESEGIRMTLVKATDDQQRKIRYAGGNRSGANYEFQFTKAPDAKSMNLTIALHKSRFVEFTVKPDMASGATSP